MMSPFQRWIDLPTTRTMTLLGLVPPAVPVGVVLPPVHRALVVPAEVDVRGRSLAQGLALLRNAGAAVRYVIVVIPVPLLLTSF